MCQLRTSRWGSRAVSYIPKSAPFTIRPRVKGEFNLVVGHRNRVLRKPSTPAHAEGPAFAACMCVPRSRALFKTSCLHASAANIKLKSEIRVLHPRKCPVHRLQPRQGKTNHPIQKSVSVTRISLFARATTLSSVSLSLHRMIPDRRRVIRDRAILIDLRVRPRSEHPGAGRRFFSVTRRNVVSVCAPTFPVTHLGATQIDLLRTMKTLMTHVSPVSRYGGLDADATFVCTRLRISYSYDIWRQQYVTGLHVTVEPAPAVPVGYSVFPLKDAELAFPPNPNLERVLQEHFNTTLSAIMSNLQTLRVPELKDSGCFRNWRARRAFKKRGKNDVVYLAWTAESEDAGVIPIRASPYVSSIRKVVPQDGENLAKLCKDLAPDTLIIDSLLRNVDIPMLRRVCPTTHIINLKSQDWNKLNAAISTLTSLLVLVATVLYSAAIQLSSATSSEQLASASLGFQKTCAGSSWLASSGFCPDPVGQFMWYAQSSTYSTFLTFVASLFCGIISAIPGLANENTLAQSSISAALIVYSLGSISVLGVIASLFLLQQAAVLHGAIVASPSVSDPVAWNGTLSNTWFANGPHFLRLVLGAGTLAGFLYISLVLRDTFDSRAKYSESRGCGDKVEFTKMPEGYSLRLLRPYSE